MAISDMRFVRWFCAIITATGLALCLWLTVNVGQAAQDTSSKGMQVILLLDNSGSIVGNRESRTLALRIARSFVDYLQAQAIVSPKPIFLGIATFGGSLITSEKLRPLPDDALRNVIVGAAVNNTDFIEPLRFAREQFSSAGSVPARKVVVLVTDGQPGKDGEPLTGITLTTYFAATPQGQLADLIQKLQADQVEVFLWTLGTEAPKYKEQWIPLIGEDHYLSFTMDTDLLTIFDALLAGSSPFGLASDGARPLGRKATLQVGSYLQEITFALIKSSPGISITLTDPDGKVLLPTGGGADMFYQVYTIATPQPGTYVVSWSGDGSVRFLSNKRYLQAETIVEPPAPEASTPVTVSARLIHTGVMTAPLTAEVGRPGGVTTTLPLQQLHGEGWHSGVFADTYDVGEYRILIRLAVEDYPKVGEYTFRVLPRPSASVMPTPPTPSPIPIASPTPFATPSPIPIASPTPPPEPIFTPTPTFTAASLPTPTETPPYEMITGPNPGSFIRGLGTGLILLVLAGVSAALSIGPMVRDGNAARQLIEDFVNYGEDHIRRLKIFGQNNAPLEPQEIEEARKIAEEGFDRITKGLGKVNAKASELLDTLLPWLIHGRPDFMRVPRDRIIRALENALHDSDRNDLGSWNVIVKGMARSYHELWITSGYPAEVKLRDIYSLLAAFCRQGSAYYGARIDSLLSALHEFQDLGLPLQNFINLYSEMLKDLWLENVDKLKVKEKLRAIVDLSDLTEMGPEGSEWHAIYETFLTYLEKNSFDEAGRILLPNFKSGRILIGVIYVLQRIHGFPNDRDPDKEKAKIRAMINHLHEPERTILKCITENWQESDHHGESV